MSGREAMSEKDLKRDAFLLAAERYNEVLPVLARLKELEDMYTYPSVSTVSTVYTWHVHSL